MNYSISLFLSISITAIVLILLKTLLKNKILPKWHFYIWIILAIRLLIPILPESNLSAFNIISKLKEPDSANSTLFGNNIRILSGNRIKNTVASKNNTKVIEPKFKFTKYKYNSTFEKYIHIALKSGSLLFGLYMIGIYIGYSNRVKKLKVINDIDIISLFSECKELSGVKSKIKLRYGGNTPHLKSLFKPEIIIPDGYTLEEYKAIFIHELMHYKNKDILWSMIATSLLCLYWYNPIIWICCFMFKNDTEILCDYNVLQVYSDKKKYASVLLKTSMKKTKPIPAVTSLYSRESSISRRIKNIVFFKKPNFIWSSLSALLIMLIGITCLTNPIAKSTNSSIATNINSKNKKLNYKKIYSYAGNIEILLENLHYGNYIDHISASLNSELRATSYNTIQTSSVTVESIPNDLYIIYNITDKAMLKNGKIVETKEMIKNAAIIFSLNETSQINFQFNYKEQSKTFSFVREYFENTIFNKELKELEFFSLLNFSKNYSTFNIVFVPILESKSWNIGSSSNNGSM